MRMMKAYAMLFKQKITSLLFSASNSCGYSNNVLDNNLGELLDMGFELTNVRAALNITDGDKVKAIDLLLQGLG